MLKRVACTIGVLALLLCCGCAANQPPQISSKAAESYVVYDASDTELPKAFRTCYSDFVEPDATYALDPTYEISRKGLDTLNVSASGQFSESQFQAAVAEIRKVSDGPIYDIDLRQESHGFFDGTAVSWSDAKNMANIDLTQAEVISDEKARLEQAEGTTQAIFTFSDGVATQTDQVDVTEACTEEQIVTRNGAKYVRFACTDRYWPSAENVDAFISFYKTLPDNAWLHFHCKGGVGRTTSFMSMYDMMHNPDVSLKDITYRQCELVSGANYLLYVPEDGWLKDIYTERAQMTQLFYNYVQDNYSNDFSVSWSDYLAAHS